MTSATCADPAARSRPRRPTRRSPRAANPRVSAPPVCGVQPSAAVRNVWLGPSAKGGRAVPQKRASTGAVDPGRGVRGRGGVPSERQRVFVGRAHSYLAAGSGGPMLRPTGRREAGPGAAAPTPSTRIVILPPLPRVAERSPGTTVARRATSMWRSAGGRVRCRSGGVAEWFRQGSAKPCTRVRFPSPPPNSHKGKRTLAVCQPPGVVSGVARRCCLRLGSTAAPNAWARCPCGLARCGASGTKNTSAPRPSSTRSSGSFERFFGVG